MQDDGKTDVANLFRHVQTDSLPFHRRAIQAIDSAMVLMIEPLGIARVHGERMRVVAVLETRVRQEIRGYAFVQRAP